MNASINMQCFFFVPQYTLNAKIQMTKRLVYFFLSRNTFGDYLNSLVFKQLIFFSSTFFKQFFWHKYWCFFLENPLVK